MANEYCAFPSSFKLQRGSFPQWRALDRRHRDLLRDRAELHGVKHQFQRFKPHYRMNPPCCLVSIELSSNSKYDLEDRLKIWRFSCFQLHWARVYFGKVATWNFDFMNYFQQFGNLCYNESKLVDQYLFVSIFKRIFNYFYQRSA